MEKQKVFSAYLPFELKCEVINSGKEKEIGTLIGVYNDGSCVFGDIVESSHGFESVKPILFSLEYLTKPITIGGKEIIAIVELANEFTNNSFNDYYFDNFFKTELIVRQKYSKDWFKIYFKNNKIIGFDNNDTELPQFDIFQKLLEWKFNVFNLPEDEYIKVTEDFNPYS